MNEKWLVTGATGFIGSHLVKALLSKDVKVHLLILPNTEELLGELESKCDISVYDGKTESVVEIFNRINPVGVFHLASKFLASHESKDINDLITSNILLGTQLLEGAFKSTTRYFVNTGTNWQHYNDEKYNPVCLYAATKKSFEDILMFYTETSTLKSTTLKLFDTYGAGDTRRKLISTLAETAVTRKPLLMSPGEQLLDLVHIKDVVSAFMAARIYLLSDNSKKYSEYGVSMGISNRISLCELVKRFETAIGYKMPVEFGKRAYRFREVMLPWTKFETPPGWTPGVTLNEGILEMIENARKSKYK
ncbi:MAG: hypothetical protein A2231_04060 [Candidatus Firestonebacteria bacterium RIFOXYA2_FULL_40_8]|nr:MAG: hypothetical protein A2231_04060 [Candidatus Firestonebacteria bacterium RIFOXYA2_FULL_40_8]